MSTIPFPESATSHRQVSAWRTQVYLEGLQNGQHDHFVLPIFFYCNSVVLIYILTPQLKGRLLRSGLWVLNTVYQLWVIKTYRSTYSAIGLIIGFGSVWNILWSAVLLVFNDSKKKFSRIRCSKIVAANGHANGHANGYVNGGPIGSSKLAQSRDGFTYQWQPVPRSFFARLSWAGDLLFNSRGIGWNWKVNGTPSRPPHIEATLQEIDMQKATDIDSPRTSTGRVRLESRRQAILHYVWQILFGVILLDVFKTIMNHDPYFWGLVNRPPPSYLPEIITSSEYATSTYRSFIAMAYIFQSLRVNFAIVPLVFLLFYSPTSGVNGQAWLYPDQFGSYKCVATRGVAGFWGGWWHQIFRYSFQAGARFVTNILGVRSKSPVGAVIELLTSFTFSALMHSAASITMIGPTRPWKDMYRFFAYQPIGIIIELAGGHLVGRYILGRKAPKWIGWIGHLVYAHLFLALTLPILIGDLAKGGIFLQEPIPFSLLRHFGYGTLGDRFYCWDGLDLSWHWETARWWRSGLVV